jgi:hypothetical protein
MALKFPDSSPKTRVFDTHCSIRTLLLDEKGRLFFLYPEPDIIRIISSRKANKREQARFEKAVADRLGMHRHDEG